MLSLSNASGDNDDRKFGDEKNNDLDSAESFEEGAALAKELYERVRVMEAKKKKDNDEREAFLRQLNSEPFRKRKQMSSAGPKSNIKSNNQSNSPFTSQRADMGNMDDNNYVEPSTYRRRNRSASSTGKSNRNTPNFMLETLSSERNILIQIVVVSILLIIAVGVGLNGGITDGSERILDDVSPLPIGDTIDEFLDRSNSGKEAFTNPEDTVFI